MSNNKDTRCVPDSCLGGWRECGYAGATQIGLDSNTEIPQQRLAKPQFCSTERKRERLKECKKKDRPPYLIAASPQMRKKKGGHGRQQSRR